MKLRYSVLKIRQHYFSSTEHWVGTCALIDHERLRFKREDWVRTKMARKHGIQPHAHRKWATLYGETWNETYKFVAQMFELCPFKLVFDASLSFVYDLILNLIANLKRVLSHRIRLFCNKNNSPCLLYNTFGSWLSCAIFKSRVFTRNMFIKVKIFQLGYPKVSYGLLSSCNLTILHWKVDSTCSLL